MSLVVRCPLCEKKLKIGEDLVGKRVKCSCGNVFVADANGAAETPPHAAPAAVGSEKVVVACGECGSKVKVPADKLGKKMKCPSCSGVFVAAHPAGAPHVARPAAPPAARVVPPPAARPIKPMVSDDEDFAYLKDEPTPHGAPRARPIAPPEPEPNLLDDDDDFPSPSHRGASASPILDDDDVAVAKPKAAAKARHVSTGPTKTPSRIVVNLLVILLALGYLSLLAAVYLNLVPLGTLSTPQPYIKSKEELKALADRISQPPQNNQQPQGTDGTGKKKGKKKLDANPIIPAEEKKTEPEENKAEKKDVEEKQAEPEVKKDAEEKKSEPEEKKDADDKQATENLLNLRIDLSEERTARIVPELPEPRIYDEPDRRRAQRADAR